MGGLQPYPKPFPSPGKGFQPLLLVALSLRYARPIRGPASISTQQSCDFLCSLRSPNLDMPLPPKLFSYLLPLTSHLLSYHVQNSFSPVSSILPLHFGHVRLSHNCMRSLPQWRHRRPTSLRYDGATSPITPPTTIFSIRLHSGQLIALMCWRNSPVPSYASAS